MELLIPTLKLLAIISYLFYWREQIMNNHHETIRLHDVYPSKVLGWIFFKKSF